MSQKFMLFRLRLILKEAQEQLFQVDKGKILEKIIQNKPGHEVRVEHYWAIGNIIQISDNLIAFKFGRSIYKNDSIYDKESRDFIIGDVEDTECIDAIYDSKFQILALAMNSQLSKPWTLAKYITKIINNTWFNFSDNLTPEEKSAMKMLTAEVRAILDPKNFLYYIRNAYKVQRFSVAFSKSNSFSPSRDFRQPVEHCADKMGADSGAVVFKSKEDLNRSCVEETAIDASVAGHKASATIIETEGTSPRPVRMGPKNDPFILESSDEDETSIFAFAKLFEKTIRNIFNR